MENGILAFPHNSSEDRTMRIEKSLKNNRRALLPVLTM